MTKLSNILKGITESIKYIFFRFKGLKDLIDKPDLSFNLNNYKDQIRNEVLPQVRNMETYYLLMEKLRCLELLEKERKKNIKSIKSHLKDERKSNIKSVKQLIFLIVFVNIINSSYLLYTKMSLVEGIVFTIITNIIILWVILRNLNIFLYSPESFYHTSFSEIQYETILEVISEELERRNNPKPKKRIDKSNPSKIIKFSRKDT